MGYYEDVYKKRLNRYGLDYQSRIQGSRERNFDTYLLKSIYRVDFNYNDVLVPASLERYKQDKTQTVGYLLTKIDIEIPNGTVLEIESQDGTKKPWMIWWKEHIESSGYNKYVVLKMTHNLTFNKEVPFTQWGYFSGPGSSTIKDTVRSSSTEAVYAENNNLYIFITTTNENFKKSDYFEVEDQGIKLGYVITGTDIHTTPGVEYISVDPVDIRDNSPMPDKKPDDSDEDYYWFNGGMS